MQHLLRIESVSQFNFQRGQETFHPLVSILDQSNSKAISAERYISDLYIVFFKDVKCEEMHYGRNKYDYQEESLLFIGPGQTFGLDFINETTIQPKGWVLLFHPDLLIGTFLGSQIHNYNFFGYHINEALHVSKKEKKIILDCFKKIQGEVENIIDNQSKTIICSYIELFLNYCVRFYNRQFITRDVINKNIVSQFDKMLHTYFETDKPQTIGLPTVAYCANHFNLSSNYFGDLIKKESGKNAQDYIQQKVIDIAKIKLYDDTLSISEVAYKLGFKYPQHFTKLFKLKTGFAPSDYRNLN